MGIAAHECKLLLLLLLTSPLQSPPIYLSFRSGGASASSSCVNGLTCPSVCHHYSSGFHFELHSLSLSPHVCEWMGEWQLRVQQKNHRIAYLLKLIFSVVLHAATTMKCCIIFLPYKKLTHLLLESWGEDRAKMPERQGWLKVYD